MKKENLHDTKRDMNDWAHMWQKACEDGVFDDIADNRADDSLPYDPLVCELSGVDTRLLDEHKTPNPVYPDSVGVDQNQPEPVWVKEDMLKEIEELKNKLFELENKFAENSGKFVDQKSGDQKIMSKIESIKKEIEQVSNTLGTEGEPSPWETEEK